MRQRITTALEVAGMCAVTASAAWTAPRLGLFVGGLCLFAAGVAGARQ